MTERVLYRAGLGVALVTAALGVSLGQGRNGYF